MEKRRRFFSATLRWNVLSGSRSRKLPVVVARRARALGLRVVGRFGRRGDGWERAAAFFDELSFEID